MVRNRKVGLVFCNVTSTDDGLVLPLFGGRWVWVSLDVEEVWFGYRIGYIYEWVGYGAYIPVLHPFIFSSPFVADFTLTLPTGLCWC
jgi:hypothetical protein